MWQRCIWTPAVAGAVAWLFLITPHARALSIELGFVDNSDFATNPTARAAIQAAADDITAALLPTSLSPINHTIASQRWRWTASSGNLTMVQSWAYFVGAEFGGIIPANNPPCSDTSCVAANEVNVLVRGQALPGNTLGTGAPSGSSFGDAGWSYNGPQLNQSQLQSRVTSLTNTLEGLINSELTRGGNGPVIGTITGTNTVNFGEGLSASEDYSVSYGPAYGTLSLDTSWGNETFEQYWHIDHTAPVPSGKNDLYSVALHEMLHAIGFGTSETWDDLSSASNWLGSEVNDEFNGVGIVDGGHVTAGRTGQNIYTGATQEAVMDPNITQGTRKFLTTLDLAFLRDLGYQTIIPDLGLDGDFNNDGIVNLADYTLWRDNLGASDESAINNNGNGGGITSADYTVWKNNFGMMSPASGSFVATASVPEPGTLALCLLAVTWVAVTARRR